MKTLNLIAHFYGDPTVGIFPTTWEIKDIGDVDCDDQRSEVREAFENAFCQLTGDEKVQIYFSDEINDMDFYQNHKNNLQISHTQAVELWNIFTSQPLTKFYTILTNKFFDQDLTIPKLYEITDNTQPKAREELRKRLIYISKILYNWSQALIEKL